MVTVTGENKKINCNNIANTVINFFLSKCIFIPMKKVLMLKSLIEEFLDLLFNMIIGKIHAELKMGTSKKEFFS